MREGNNGSELQAEFELFFGKHYKTYETRHIRYKHHAFGWNLWAALFHVVWFGYHKYYKPALLFIAVLFLIDAVAYCIGWNTALPMINITPISLGTLIVGMILCGLFANLLYYRHAVHTIYKVKESRGDDSAKQRLLQSKGGTSNWGAAIMLVTVISMFFLSHSFFPTSTDIINKVRSGSLYEHPFYPIGESFGQYFHDTNWTYHRFSGQLELVEFHGNVKDETRNDVVIQFLVDYHLSSIELYTIEVNGSMQNKEQIKRLTDEIFQVENPFELNEDPEHGKKAF